jgi:site-specific recombinase XerD
MQAVEPIRDMKKIEKIIKTLRGKKTTDRSNYRNASLMLFAFNSALRVSDILNLKWESVFDFKKKKFYEHVYLEEQKTEKAKKMKLNKGAIMALTELKEQYFKNAISPELYLFQSREGENQALSRFMALKILQDAAEEVGCREIIGMHSTRKSFCYHSWKSGVPLVIIQDILNHSSSKVTKAYLGINQDEKDKVMDSISFEF